MHRCQTRHPCFLFPVSTVVIVEMQISVLPKIMFLFFCDKKLCIYCKIMLRIKKGEIVTNVKWIHVL